MVIGKEILRTNRVLKQLLVSRISCPFQSRVDEPEFLQSKRRELHGGGQGLAIAGKADDPTVTISGVNHAVARLERRDHVGFR